MRSTNWDLSVSVGAGPVLRSLEVAESGGVQAEVSAGPLLKLGGVSVGMQAAYNRSFLGDGLLVGKDGFTIRTTSMRVLGGLEVGGGISAQVHAGAGWANYDDRVRSADFGNGFSVRAEMGDGAHWEAGAAVCFWDRRLCASGAYSRDSDVVRLQASAGRGREGPTHSYSAEGWGLLLRTDLSALIGP